MKKTLQTILNKWIAVVQKLNQLIITMPLIILFIGIITPLALLKKLFTKKPKEGFVIRKHLYKREDLKKMW